MSSAGKHVNWAHNTLLLVLPLLSSKTLHEGTDLCLLVTCMPWSSSSSPPAKRNSPSNLRKDRFKKYKAGCSREGSPSPISPQTFCLCRIVLPAHWRAPGSSPAILIHAFKTSHCQKSFQKNETGQSQREALPPVGQTHQATCSSCAQQTLLIRCCREGTVLGWLAEFSFLPQQGNLWHN